MPTTTSDFDDFAEVLQAERDVRSLFIVGSSRIDQLLLEILTAYLLPRATKGNNDDELLEGDKCPFSVRIKMCWRLGLIDDSLFRDLEALRKIRNKCAHTVIIDHARAPMKDLITNFRKEVERRKSFALAKKRFFEDENASFIEGCQCALLTICALLESVKTNISITTGNSKTRNISAR